MSLGLKNEVPEKRKEIANFADEPKPIVVPKHPDAIIQSLPSGGGNSATSEENLEIGRSLIPKISNPKSEIAKIELSGSPRLIVQFKISDFGFQ